MAQKSCAAAGYNSFFHLEKNEKSLRLSRRRRERGKEWWCDSGGGIFKSKTTEPLSGILLGPDEVCWGISFVRSMFDWVFWNSSRSSVKAGLWIGKIGVSDESELQYDMIFKTKSKRTCEQVNVNATLRYLSVDHLKHGTCVFYPEWPTLCVPSRAFSACFCSFEAILFVIRMNC